MKVSLVLVSLLCCFVVTEEKPASENKHLKQGGGGETLQQLHKQLLEEWRKAKGGRPFTAKQQAWWDSLGVRHPQSETKQNVKIRKEVRQLTDSEWHAYTDAVNALNRLYPDPNDNRTQYQLFTEAHLFEHAPAAHGGAAFLVWHREFLWRLERALQLQNPDLAIPYWDTGLEYHLPNPGQSVIFSEFLFGHKLGHVDTGPFAGFQVLQSCIELFEDRGYNYTHLFRAESYDNLYYVRLRIITEENLETILNETTYTGLSTSPYELESEHAGPHFFVGGIMGNAACSPADPIFFSHHAFVDWIFQEFRDHSQVTPLETEYPSGEDIHIGGPLHEAYADMAPFPGLYNIHGLSSHYTDYYFNYAPRHYTSCVTSQDCTSQYLWCDVTRGRCISKIHAGGNCRGLEDESCYGDNFSCVNDVCTGESENAIKVN